MGNSNTKKLKRISEQTLLVTVDIGKVKHTGYYRFPDGADGKTFEFCSSRKGFEEMWQRVFDAKRSRNLTDVVVGFESTGPYAEPLLHFLRMRNARLVQVNPLHTKRLKELEGNSPNKTDQKDPKVIADIVELGHALTVIIPEGTLSGTAQVDTGQGKKHTEDEYAYESASGFGFSYFSRVHDGYERYNHKKRSVYFEKLSSASGCCGRGCRASDEDT